MLLWDTQASCNVQNVCHRASLQMHAVQAWRLKLALLFLASSLTFKIRQNQVWSSAQTQGMLWERFSGNKKGCFLASLGTEDARKALYLCNVYIWRDGRAYCKRDKVTSEKHKLLRVVARQQHSMRLKYLLILPSSELPECKPDSKVVTACEFGWLLYKTSYFNLQLRASLHLVFKSTFSFGTEAHHTKKANPSGFASRLLGGELLQIKPNCQGINPALPNGKLLLLRGGCVKHLLINHCAMQIRAIALMSWDWYINLPQQENNWSKIVVSSIPINHRSSISNPINSIL